MGSSCQCDDQSLSNLKTEATNPEASHLRCLYHRDSVGKIFRAFPLAVVFLPIVLFVLRSPLSRKAAEGEHQSYLRPHEAYCCSRRGEAGLDLARLQSCHLFPAVVFSLPLRLATLKVLDARRYGRRLAMI